MTLQFVSHPFWQHLSIVLGHFIWQAAVAALLAWLLIILFRPRRPQVRYAVYLAAFLMLPCVAGLTFSIANAPDRSHQFGPLASPAGDVIASSGDDAAPAVNRAGEMTPAGQGGRWLDAVGPWFILGWLAGVSLFGLRLVWGAAAIAWIRRQARTAPIDLLARTQQLSGCLGLRVPRVVVSRHVRQALAAGLFRPVILLPASWATGLSPEMAEAVLAHELAHLRRHDVWLNALQRVVETVFFYHPAVWWLSARVRTERELCCDDLAVAATGNRLAYASALELAVRGACPPGDLLLANGIGGRQMAVLERVRHVLNLEPRSGRRGWWPGGMAALAVPALIWCVAANWQPARAGHDEPGAARTGERDTVNDAGARADWDAAWRQWDVVVFKDAAESENKFIKRLVGLPDEAIAQREERPNERESADQRDGDRDDPRLQDSERHDEAGRERPERLREMVVDRLRGESLARDHEDSEDFERMRSGDRDGDYHRREGEREPRGPRDPRNRDAQSFPRGPEFDRRRFREHDEHVEIELRGRGDQSRAQRELLEVVRELRREVEELRHEVRELRESRPDHPFPSGGPPRFRDAPPRDGEDVPRFDEPRDFRGAPRPAFGGGPRPPADSSWPRPLNRDREHDPGFEQGRDGEPGRDRDRPEGYRPREYRELRNHEAAEQPADRNGDRSRDDRKAEPDRDGDRPGEERPREERESRDRDSDERPVEGRPRDGEQAAEEAADDAAIIEVPALQDVPLLQGSALNEVPLRQGIGGQPFSFWIGATR